MVRKTFGSSPQPERAPRVEGPPLRSHGSDDDFDYSYSQGTSSAGGGFLIICVIIIVLGFLKFTGCI